METKYSSSNNNIDKTTPQCASCHLRNNPPHQERRCTLGARLSPDNYSDIDMHFIEIKQFTDGMTVVHNREKEIEKQIISPHLTSPTRFRMRRGLILTLLVTQKITTEKLPTKLPWRPMPYWNQNSFIKVRVLFSSWMCVVHRKSLEKTRQLTEKEEHEPHKERRDQVFRKVEPYLFHMRHSS